MAQKLFVNNTNATVEIILAVRAGEVPGQVGDTINASVAPNAQQMVTYGDSNNPYIDQLTISTVNNGSLTLTDQIVLSKSAELDNELNMNDTIYIALQGTSFVITSGNTWTV